MDMVTTRAEAFVYGDGGGWTAAADGEPVITDLREGVVTFGRKSVVHTQIKLARSGCKDVRVLLGCAHFPTSGEEKYATKTIEAIDGLAGFGGAADLTILAGDINLRLDAEATRVSLASACDGAGPLACGGATEPEANETRTRLLDAFGKSKADQNESVKCKYEGRLQAGWLDRVLHRRRDGGALTHVGRRDDSLFSLETGLLIDSDHLPVWTRYRAGRSCIVIPTGKMLSGRLIFFPHRPHRVLEQPGLERGEERVLELRLVLAARRRRRHVASGRLLAAVRAHGGDAFPVLADEHLAEAARHRQHVVRLVRHEDQRVAARKILVARHRAVGLGGAEDAAGDGRLEQHVEREQAAQIVVPRVDSPPPSPIRWYSAQRRFQPPLGASKFQPASRSTRAAAARNFAASAGRWRSSALSGLQVLHAPRSVRAAVLRRRLRCDERGARWTSAISAAESSAGRCGRPWWRAQL